MWAMGSVRPTSGLPPPQYRQLRPLRKSGMGQGTRPIKNATIFSVQVFATTNLSLSARSDSLNQRKRQAGLLHALLNSGNIIRNAPKFNDLVIQVGDGKRGARIAVPRLADRARVQQIPRPRLHSQGSELRPVIRAELNHADLPGAIGEAALMMRMSEKCYVRGRFQKSAHGLTRNEDVFIFIIEGSMNQ